MPDSITSNSPSNFLDHSFDTIVQLGEKAADTYDNSKESLQEFVSERKDEVVDYGMNALSEMDFLDDEQVIRLENMIPGYDEKEQATVPLIVIPGCSLSATLTAVKSEKNTDELAMSANVSVTCGLDDTPVSLGVESGMKVLVDKDILNDPNVGNLIRSAKEVAVDAGPVENVNIEKRLLSASANFKQKAGLTFDREGLKSVDFSESHATSLSGGIGLGQEVGDIDTDYFMLTGSLSSNTGVSYGRDETIFKAKTEVAVEAGSEKLFAEVEFETNGNESKLTPSAGHYDWKESTNIDVKGLGYSNESVKKISDFGTALKF